MQKVNEREALRRWRRDPTAFIKEVLVDPEAGKPFELYPAQERFLREALTPGADGVPGDGVRCTQKERQDGDGSIGGALCHRRARGTQ
jgi:hypothetical protein